VPQNDVGIKQKDGEKVEGFIAPWHIIIVLVVALLVFGPKKLPQLGHSLGQSISGFRRGMEDAKEEFSGVMKEATEVAQPAETSVTNSSAPAAPAPLPEPTMTEPVAASSEQPAEPVVKL
jgi:sec-independent protein translocase protein TatA